MEGMKRDQAYLGLIDALDWVLEKSVDDSNSFEDSTQFLQHLLVNNNLYTEQYVRI